MSEPKDDTPSPDWAARRARAVAFIRHELKRGQDWTSKRYEYTDSKSPEATGRPESDDRVSSGINSCIGP